MAAEDGGYSNPAMDPESEAVAETSLSTDELCLRVDKLEVRDSPKTEGAIINTEDMVEVPSVGGDDDMPLPNITRNRPFSASTVSRQTVGSTRSHASRSASIVTTEYSAKSLFSYRVCSFSFSGLRLNFRTLKTPSRFQLIMLQNCRYRRI